MPENLCTCQMRADGPDYGQAWTSDPDTGLWRCASCGGEIRLDQARKWAKEWIDGMTKPGPRPPFGSID